MDTKNVIATLSQNLLDEVKKIMKKEKAEKSEKGESEADEKREHCSEALKGDQHKIDANKNGKVDAHDFHLLRKKKKKVAETYTALKNGEEISEEEVEEAVKEPYAVGMAAAMKATGDKPPLKKSTIMKAHKIAKKIKEETGEVSEDAEQIDELSDRMLTSYAKKANKQGVKIARSGVSKAPGNEHLARKLANRQDGEEMARTKLAMRREEVEDLEELSTEKLLAYRNKAKAGDVPVRRGVGIDTADEKIKKKTGSYNPSLLQRAKAKLTKEELDQVELTQEELDRLDAMMADLEEGRGRPPKEGSDAWKKRQEAGAAEQDEPRQHPIQQLERIKRDMRGGGDFKHKDGSTHHVTGGQAAKILDKYHGLKPAEKEAMQKEIHGSHAGLKKHL